ncbi:MAG: isoprenylcysteine carboxylmethyltransferase family protein [Candidatus Bathyarchaeota archaeon]|nr:MAG: isoprenylcysteine carboxylmethyltransferase family protein [Candidatus Bathyarchaeota archaeon]
MSFIPAFELGVWNAWIFLIPIFIMHIINARVQTGGPSVKILIVFFIILHLLPFLLPLQLNTIWFYAGLLPYIVGLTIAFLAIYGFAITPVDKPVITGIFRYSRNPMYLGGFFFFIGISLVSLSWIYFLIGLVWMILTHVLEIPVEESECIEKFGTDYAEYMKKTPKWIGIPKSEETE